MDILSEWQVEKYARQAAQPAEDGKDWEILESSDGRVITLTMTKAGVLKVVVSGLLLEYWNLCQTKDMRVLQRDHSLLFLCRAKGAHRKWRVMFGGSSGKVAEERCSQCLRAIHTFLHPSFHSQSLPSSQNTTHSQNVNTQPKILNTQTQPLRNTSQPPRHASQSLLQSSQSFPTSQSLVHTSQHHHQHSQSLLTSQSLHQPSQSRLQAPQSLLQNFQSFPPSQSLQTTQLPYQTTQSLLQTSQSFPTSHTIHQTSQPPTTSQYLPTSQSMQQPPATHSILATTQTPPSSTQPLQKAANVSQPLPPPPTTLLQNSQTLPPMPPLHTAKPSNNPLPAFQQSLPVSQLPPPPPLLNHPQPPQNPLLPPSSQSFPQVSHPLPSPQQLSEQLLPPHQQVAQSLPPLNQTSESIPQPSQTSQSLLQPCQSSQLLPSTHQTYQSLPLPHQTSQSLPLRPQASYPLPSPYLYTQPPFSAPHPPLPLYPQYPGVHLHAPIHNNQCQPTCTEGAWVPGHLTHSVLRPQPIKVHNPLVLQPPVVSTTQQLSHLYPTLPRSDGLPSGCNMPPPASQANDSDVARATAIKCTSKVKGSKKKPTVKRRRKPKVPLQQIDVNTDAWPPVLGSLGDGDGQDGDGRLKEMVISVLRDPGLPHLVHTIHNIITNM